MHNHKVVIADKPTHSNLQSDYGLLLLFFSSFFRLHPFLHVYLSFSKVKHWDLNIVRYIPHLQFGIGILSHGGCNVTYCVVRYTLASKLIQKRERLKIRCC